MPRTKEILILVGVEILVHRDGEDVFARRFVMHLEVVGVVVFERIACRLQFFAIANGGLPGVKLFAIDGENDVFTLLAGVTYRIVAEKNLGV